MPNSTSNSEFLVQIENLNMTFQLQFNQQVTLRGQFVDFAKNPYSFFFREKDFLHVLKNIHLNAKAGDRIALLGRNGAGKTTLCRCLAGIYQTKPGTIKARGKVRALLDPNFVIHPELTGRENAEILTSLFYPELSKAQKAQVLQEALAFSDLKEFLDTPFRHYSSGMQTRLCLSVATSQSADIFILDEVFEAADQAFKEKIAKRILALIESAGVVFFVSHSEDQVRKVCNKALILESGEATFYDQVEDGLKAYKNLLNV